MLLSTLLISVMACGDLPPELDDWRLAPCYTQCRMAGPLPVLATDSVHPVALDEALWLIHQMIGHRPDVLQAMADNRTRYVVMGCNEFTTDVPEHMDLYPRPWWDARARGLGATFTRPAVSCGEENLLGLDGDPYYQENILIHEFAHAVHQMGLVRTDPTFDGRLREAFAAAQAAGRWAGTYANTNHFEYWAEGVQSWFDTNRSNDAEHGPVDTRDELKAYDPQLAALCAEVFGDGPWRYEHPRKRLPDAPGTAHLKHFDHATARAFVRNPARQQAYAAENERRKATARKPGEAVDEWLDRRIGAGCFDAMVNLSRRHRDGDGVARSHALALQLLQPAVEAGYPPALDHAGWILWRGDEAVRNVELAETLLRRSAQAGHVQAMLNMAQLAPDEAVEWWTRAAYHGHPVAVDALDARDAEAAKETP